MVALVSICNWQQLLGHELKDVLARKWANADELSPRTVCDTG